MGIEPPGGGRGKSKRQSDRDNTAPAGRSSAGSSSTHAASQPPSRGAQSSAAASSSARKRSAAEMSAPGATAAVQGSMLQYLVHAFSACSVVVEERATDSTALYTSMVARSSKSARASADQHTAIAAAAQASRVRASIIKAVAKAAAQLQAAAQLLGQAMGSQVALPTPAMPADVATYLAQVLESRRSSAVPLGGGGGNAQRPAGIYGLPLGHSAAGASNMPLQFSSTAGVRVPSRVSSVSTPALPMAVSSGSTPQVTRGLPSVRSPDGFAAPMRSNTGTSHHPSRVSVATGYTSRVGGAGTAGGGGDANNALSQFATLAAEAWERESAASGLSSTPINAAGEGGGTGGGRAGSVTGGGRRGRRSTGAASSSQGRASAEMGNASGSAGRSSAVLLRGGVGGQATPLSPSPADIPDGGSDVAGVSGGVLPAGAQRRAGRRRRGDSTLEEGNVSDADSTRAAPAIAAPAIRSALDVSFAADDDDDRFDPFDFIDAADLSMRKAAGGGAVQGRPPPIRAPQPKGERRSAVSPVMFGMVGASNFGGLKGAEGGMDEAPSGMLPHQMSGPIVPPTGVLPSMQGAVDAGLVGASAPMPRAGSALSSIGHSTTIGRMRHPLLPAGALSIASSGGGPQGGVFPSPVPPPSRQRSNSNASSSLGGDLLLGGEVMGLRPLDSVSAAPSPAGREGPRGRRGSLQLGSEAASSPTKGNRMGGGGSVEGPYGYTAWGAGMFGGAPPLTPLAMPAVGDSVVQGMLSANGSSTGGTSASAGGRRGSVPTIPVKPGGVVSMAEGGGDSSPERSNQGLGGDILGAGTGFTSAEGLEAVMWPPSSVGGVDKGGAAQLHGDTVDSREW